MPKQQPSRSFAETVKQKCNWSMMRTLLMHLRPIFLFSLVLSLVGCDAIEGVVGGKSLSAEERRQMDVQLFNELAVRSHDWEGRSRQRRYLLLKAMGEKGFEPASLAIRLFDVKPGSWLRPFDKEAYERLRVLADSGAHTAECLFAMAMRKWKIKKDTDKIYYDKIYPYIKKAAKGEQARCTAFLSGMYRSGKGGFPKSEAKSREVLLKAARLGNQGSQLTVFWAYAQGDGGFPRDFGEAECWYKVAEKAGTGAARSESNTMIGIYDETRFKKLSWDKYDPASLCSKKVESVIE